MAIPLLNENGLLPPGIHNCSLAEIRTRFGGFQASDQRPRLLGKLEMFLVEVRAAGMVQAVIVNGSFVTATAAPNDIDLLLALFAGHDFRADLGPLQYNIVDRHRVRRVFGFDVFVAEENSPDYAALVQFFQRVRLQPHLSKGILRIEL